MTDFIPFPPEVVTPITPRRIFNPFFAGQNIRVDVTGSVGGVTNSPLSKSATAVIQASTSTSIGTVTVSGPTLGLRYRGDQQHR